MEKYGGSNWNYEKIKAEYLKSENYSGPITDVFGTAGELSIFLFFFLCIFGVWNCIPISLFSSLTHLYTLSNPQQFQML
jgi:hypothetical protein